MLLSRPIRSKSKSIVARHSHAFSRACHLLHVFASSSDWLIRLLLLAKIVALRHSNAQFAIVCLVTWPLSENEAKVDHALKQTYLLNKCKSCWHKNNMVYRVHRYEKQEGFFFYHSMVNFSLTLIQTSCHNYTTLN